MKILIDTCDSSMVNVFSGGFSDEFFVWLLVLSGLGEPLWYIL